MSEANGPASAIVQSRTRSPSSGPANSDTSSFSLCGAASNPVTVRANDASARVGAPDMREATTEAALAEKIHSQFNVQVLIARPDQWSIDPRLILLSALIF